MSDPRPPAPTDARSSLLDRSEERFALLVESVQDYGIFMLDATGHVMSWNRGAEKINGWQAHEIIGRSFETFYTPEAIAAHWPQTELRCATADGRFEDRGWRVRKDGTQFWANVIITALRGPDGELRGFGKVTRDLTEQRLQEEALRQSEEQFRLLVESVSDYAIFMLDPQGHIRTWNSGARAIHGHEAADVLGSHFSRFFTPDDRAAGRPQRELDTARRLGHAQDQGWRLRADGSVFWAEVMVTPVMNAQGDLRGFAKVTRDLSEQRRLTELEHASQRMSEFLAMLGHELRNPLAPIRNAVSILNLQTPLPEVVARTRDIIGRQVGHLTRLVDDLLDVGRIVTGKILLQPELIDYRETVQASLEAVRPLIDAKRHHLRVTLPPQPVWMTGDPTRLAQALQNLLGNACRYTPEGGEIALAVHIDGQACITTVSDNGQGIEAGALERIFELFAQGEAERTPHDSGLGIGLSLARTLVEQHGGMLSCHSDGPGRGSTFTVRLPLRREAATPAAAPQAAPEAPAALRVLVVDDNRDSADTMVELLGMLGHEPLAAYGAEAALRAAGSFYPQLALIDLNMPDGDGFSVLQRLRALLTPQPLLAAAMTGYGQQSDREHTLAAGFDAHLTKPVGIEQIEQLLLQATAG
jgi:PAS domain S-box-containing protein